MKQSFRDFLRALDGDNELAHIRKPVDVRDISALVSQSSRAVLFENVKEYPGWQVAGGLITSRKRLGLAMGCDENDVARRFEKGLEKLIEPVIVTDAPCQEVVLTGKDVDLTSIPYPLMHRFD